MKNFGFLFLFYVLTALSCTKEQKFKRAIHSKWNIDKIESALISSGCGSDLYEITGIQEDVGTINFTNEKLESKVAYSTTDTQYKGYINYTNGNVKEFTYEYFQKLNETYQVTIFDSEYVGLNTEVMTNKTWVMTINNYDGNCYYNTITYYLSK